jgi:hypothetical protein
MISSAERNSVAVSVSFPESEPNRIQGGTMSFNPHNSSASNSERTLDEIVATERTVKLARTTHDQLQFDRRETRRAIRETLRDLTYAALDFSADTDTLFS